MKIHSFLSKLYTLFLIVYFLVAHAGVSVAIGEDFDPTKEYKVNSQTVIRDSSSVPTNSVGRHQFNGSPVEAESEFIRFTRPEAVEGRSSSDSNSFVSGVTEVFSTRSFFSRTREVLGNTVSGFTGRIGSAISGVRNVAGSSVRSLSRSLGNLIPNFSFGDVLQPLRRLATNISNGFTTVSSHISTWFNEFVLDWQTAIQNFPQDPAHLLTNIALLSLSVSPGIAFFVWNPTTGKPIKQLMRTLYEGPISVVDLYLHAICAMVATFDTTFRGYDWTFSYNASKDFMKRVSGRDIGEWQRDAVLGVATLTIAITLYFAPAVIAAAKAGTLYMMTEGNTAVTETSQECVVGCVSPEDFGITLAFNMLPGFTPDFEADQAIISTKNALLKQSDEISEAGKSLSRTSNNSRVIIVEGVEYRLTEHAVERMTKRHISANDIQEVISKGEKFSYLHEDIIKTGYYSHERKMFIAFTDKITTVIDDVEIKYINNLKGKK